MVVMSLGQSCAQIMHILWPETAWAMQGRMLVYAITYSLGATRCIIIHLATSESLQHAISGEDTSLMLCGLAVPFISLALVQVPLLPCPLPSLKPLQQAGDTSPFQYWKPVWLLIGKFCPFRSSWHSGVPCRAACFWSRMHLR